MAGYSVTGANRVKQAPTRGHHEEDVVHAILDEGWVAHIGFMHGGQQVVIPTFYVRDGKQVLIHGSRKARMFRTLADGVALSLCVTLLDGLVMARSGFHHSMNYRSVVLHGAASEVRGAEKTRALDLFVERTAKGRAAHVRPLNEQENKATMVLAVPLETVAAKVRQGPPIDDEEDMDLPIWAGVIPMAMRYGEPIADTGLAAGLQPPKPG